MKFTVYDGYNQTETTVLGLFKTHKKVLDYYLKEHGDEPVACKTGTGYIIKDENGKETKYLKRAIPTWLYNMQVKSGMEEEFNKAKTKEEILQCVEPIRRNNTILTEE